MRQTMSIMIEKENEKTSRTLLSNVTAITKNRMKRHERNVKETLSKIPKILRINNQTAYEFVKVLGFGGYAVAFSAKLVNVEEKDDDKMNVLNGPDMVAIKIIIKNNFDSNKMKQVTTYTEREIKIMSKLNHTNIVKLYDHWIDDNCIYIILELCINKYQAPEMIQRKGYSFGVDIWALGCVSYRLYYGNVPFDGQTNDEIYKAIVSKCPKYCRVSKCNESIENHEILVLKSMLHKNVDLRAKIDTLLQNEKYFLLEKNNPQLNHNKKRASIQELANLQTINLSNKRKRSQSQDVNNMIQCLQKISSKKKLSPNNVEAKNKLNSKRSVTKCIMIQN
ncbi:Serine/threonine-protein kinase plk1 [Blomia tropicalis]|nr:Serine/threonine-protein kinase plk1 [Blomia tropicalis]